MNPTLANVLHQLHLEPGTYRCELPEQEIVVQVRSRKVRDEASSSETEPQEKTEEQTILDDSCMMLDPWVELPTPKPIGRVVGRLAPLPPPDLPEIPAEDEIP